MSIIDTTGSTRAAQAKLTAQDVAKSDSPGTDQPAANTGGAELVVHDGRRGAAAYVTPPAATASTRSAWTSAREPITHLLETGLASDLDGLSRGQPAIRVEDMPALLERLRRGGLGASDRARLAELSNIKQQPDEPWESYSAKLNERQALMTKQPDDAVIAELGLKVNAALGPDRAPLKKTIERFEPVSLEQIVQQMAGDGWSKGPLPKVENISKAVEALRNMERHRTPIAPEDRETWIIALGNNPIAAKYRGDGAAKQVYEEFGMERLATFATASDHGEDLIHAEWDLAAYGQARPGGFAELAAFQDEHGPTALLEALRRVRFLQYACSSLFGHEDTSLNALADAVAMLTFREIDAITRAHLETGSTYRFADEGALVSAVRDEVARLASQGRAPAIEPIQLTGTPKHPTIDELRDVMGELREGTLTREQAAEAARTIEHYLVSIDYATRTSKNQGYSLVEMERFCSRRSSTLGFVPWTPEHLRLKNAGIRANQRASEIKVALADDNRSSVESDLAQLAAVKPLSQSLATVAHAIRMLEREDDLPAAWERGKAAYAEKKLWGGLNSLEVVQSFIDGLAQGSIDTLRHALANAEQHYRVLTADGSGANLHYNIALTLRATRAAINLKLDVYPGQNSFGMTIDIDGVEGRRSDDTAWQFEKMDDSARGRVILQNDFVEGEAHALRFIGRLAIGSIIGQLEQHVADAAVRNPDPKNGGKDYSHAFAQDENRRLIARFAAELSRLPENEWTAPWAGNGPTPLEALARLTQATDDLEFPTGTPAEIIAALAAVHAPSQYDGWGTIYT